MERKRSFYLAVVIVVFLAINHWLLGDVISRGAFVLVKKPFGAIQRVVVRFVKPPRDQAREQFIDQTVKIEKLERENDQLRKQLGVSARSTKSQIVADIISFEQNNIASAITIDKGSDDGVKEGLAVVSGGNVLLGVVREVFPRSSRVYLIDDPRVRMSIRILNSPLLAELEGSLRGKFILNLIARSETVNFDAMVVTSGLDGLPENLVVGTITTIEDKPDGLFRDARGKVMYNLGNSAVIFVIL